MQSLSHCSLLARCQYNREYERNANIALASYKKLLIAEYILDTLKPMDGSQNSEKLFAMYRS